MYAKIAILAAVAAFATAAPAAVADNSTFVGEFGPEGDVMPMIASCTDCLSNGYAWNKATKECVKLGCKSADCVNDIRKCYTKPVKPVAPVVDCEEAEPVAKPTICTNMPAGICKDSVMVPDVAYTVEEPIFGCEGKKSCKETNVWCEIKQDKKGNYVEKYTYCCGDKCKEIPEEETCEYKGKDYVLGRPYDKKDKEGKKYTMWFTDCDEEPIKCSGKKCGSTPELTPPGIDVCPVPKPIVINTPAAGNAPLRPNPTYKNCISCIENGGSWNENKLECYPGGNNGPDAIMCPFGADDSCHADIGRCPMPLGESMAL